MPVPVERHRHAARQRRLSARLHRQLDVPGAVQRLGEHPVQQQLEPDADPSIQRKVVDAFLAAARDGDFDALVAVLDPNVVLKADLGAGVSREVRGAAEVAGQAVTYSRLARFAHPALVNGTPGLVEIRNGRPYTVLAFTVTGGKIAELDILADRRRLQQLDLTILGD